MLYKTACLLVPYCCVCSNISHYLKPSNSRFLLLQMLVLPNVGTFSALAETDVFNVTFFSCSLENKSIEQHWAGIMGVAQCRIQW
jgi:hypothetical protein